MRQQVSRIVPVVVALLLGGAAAQAQAPDGDGPQGPGPVGEGPQGAGPERRGPRGPQAGLTRMLELNEAQQEKLREILDQQRPQREALHERMSANREALHQLLESGSADANAVGELVLEGRRLRDEGKALFDVEQKSIRAILTADQQKKFDAMQERMRERGPRGGPEGFGPAGPAPGGFGGPGGSGAPGFTKQPRSSQPPVQF